jgi:glutamyl-tRNA reductase
MDSGRQRTGRADCMNCSLIVAGVSYRSAPLALREHVTVTPATAEEVASQPGVREAVALSTCNRSELYLVAEQPELGDAAAGDALTRLAGGSLNGAVRSLRDLDAAQHLFRVTAGLESMVVGEAEIQGQVRRAYERALAQGTSGPVSNRLFQDALRAGKRVRTRTGISRSAASIASIAVSLARHALGGLSGRRALVVGAGKHGELTAQALAAQGAGTVFVASRAHDRADELARRFGGEAVSFDHLAEQLACADVVLTCTACPHRVITRRDLAAAGRRNLVVIDTAVPRDVEPAARELPHVQLFDLDDIERELDRNLAARRHEVASAERILERELEGFKRWLAALDVMPTISALRQRGDAAVERALRQNAGRWVELSDDDRGRVELLARAVVSDLLHEPTRRLRLAGENGAPSPYVETVRELFGLRV